MCCCKYSRILKTSCIEPRLCTVNRPIFTVTLIAFLSSVCVCVCVQVHFLYQYSLLFFLDIFQVVLSANPHLRGITEHSRRLAIITKDMFQVCLLLLLP